MDALTLKRAQKGDPAAFEALFTPLEGRVYRTCVHVLGPGEDARDCAQEVLLKAFRTLKDFRGDCALESWLHRLCVNVCLDTLRKNRLRATQSLEALMDEGFGPAAPADGPYASLEKKERMEAVRRAIAGLPEEQRLAFTLVVLEELPYEEAAERLGTAVGTVKSRVNRAREKISKICLSETEPLDLSHVQLSEGRAVK